MTGKVVYADKRTVVVIIEANAAPFGSYRICRDDGTVTVEPIPHEPTALELVERIIANDERSISRHHLAQLCIIRDQIKAGNHGGPTT